MPYRDREKLRAYQREWCQRRRREFFAGKTCDGCASTRDLRLHHREPSLKVSHKIWSWSDARRAAELAKCVVLCDQCHRATHGEGVRLRPGRRTAQLVLSLTEAS